MDYKFDKVDERFEKLEKKVNILPTSEEFLGAMDKIYTNQMRIEQEQTFMKEQINCNEHNINSINNHLKLQSA